MKTKIQYYLIVLALLASVSRTLGKFSDDANQTKVQGVLSVNGVAASGNYDFIFTLYDCATNGDVIGASITNAAVALNSNGLFVTTVDFGSNVWAGNTTNWLDISVQPSGSSNGFTELTSRLLLTATPQAVYAFSSGASTNFSGTLSGDISGSQGATVVATVGGQTATNIALAAIAVSGATSSDTPSTLVQRDPSGNIGANSVTLDGSLNLPFPAIMYSGTNIFMIEEGSLYAGILGANAIDANPLGLDNTGFGDYALNYTAIHGVGSYNTAIGEYALQNNTASYNTASGYRALQANTSGTENTATGAQALLNNTTGSYNTATGLNAMVFNTAGAFNTATGINALEENTAGEQNTATGTDALQYNQTGNYNTGVGVSALQQNSTGSRNTAIGFEALFNNSTSNNTATGYQALFGNTTGTGNTADGAAALQNNATGTQNSANGLYALFANTTGSYNTANGAYALSYNTSGTENTANGMNALHFNVSGSQNTADGTGALDNSTGYNNIAIGFYAGDGLVSGNNNIYIGNSGTGCNFSPSESYTIRIGETQNSNCITSNALANTYIAGIYDNGSLDGTQVPVYVDECGHLGVVCSSERYKQNIRSMDDASDVLLALRPVKYQYKPNLDAKGRPQFGLVAEEVDKVDPDLVVHDERHGIYTVRYEAINAMLLNEFLKQHRKVEDQNAEIETLKGKTALVDEQSAEIQDLKQSVADLKRMLQSLVEKK